MASEESYELVDGLPAGEAPLLALMPPPSEGDVQLTSNSTLPLSVHVRVLDGVCVCVCYTVEGHKVTSMGSSLVDDSP